MSSTDLFPSMNVTATALQAERVRMEVAANNLANAHSTRGADGELYQRRVVVFSSVYEDSLAKNGPGLGGVQVEGVEPDGREPVKVNAPYHPDADEQGMVEEPNISMIEEMMDMVSASRAYQANLTAMKQSRTMAQRTITLGRQK